jgi:hypothetical protein
MAHRAAQSSRFAGIEIMKIKTLTLSCFGLLVSSLSGAEAYKWVDDKGNVNYGDRPPPERASTEVPIAPAPAAEAIQEARERLRRLEEAERQSHPSAEGAAPPGKETAGATAPPGRVIRDVECFTPLDKAWGGRIADTREGPSRRPLTGSERQWIKGLLRSFEGSWTGTIVETNCLAPDANPATEIFNIEARLEGRWESDHVFRLEAKLFGKETRDVSREFYWFAPSPEGLRAYAAYTDLSVDVDVPANDVELLDLKSGELAFFWRYGRGGVREASVFSLRRFGQGFKIGEFSFVQGTCSDKRLWTIRR